MDLLSKSDFDGDLTQFDGLNPMEMLLIVAKKASEKEENKAAAASLSTVSKNEKQKPLDDHHHKQTGKRVVVMEVVDDDGHQRRKLKGKGVAMEIDEDEDEDDNDYKGFPLMDHYHRRPIGGIKINEVGPSNNDHSPPQHVPPQEAAAAHENNNNNNGLPERYRNKIRGMGGSDVKFVYQKALTETDFSKQSQRFNMPKKQCAVPLEELDELGRNAKVDVIHPNEELTVHRLNFTSWNSPSWYVFNQKSWIEFVTSSGNLQIADIVQVWKFGLPHGRTGFAFVKL